MDPESPFDRRVRRLRRDRAGLSFASVADLYRMVSDELVERLDTVTRSFSRALVLGCPDGALTASLEARGLEVTCADPGFAFAHSAGGLQCDEDRLPFARGSFDVILTIGLLDTVNDLPGALVLMRQALRPDGLLLAAFAGAGSLPRLRSAMMAADDATGGVAPRIHPQIDVRAAGDLLTRAGFTMPVADVHDLHLRYPHLMALVKDLRSAAATNILAARNRRPILRTGLRAALDQFQSFADADGRVAEAVEIVYLTAWSPSPDQPKPARRGSATARLGDALKPPARS